jgi:hypothetical protein
MRGERYLGNAHKLEVHDLDNEKPMCQIDEIIRAGHEKPFNPLDDAHKERYDNCAHCLGSSLR